MKKIIELLAMCLLLPIFGGCSSEREITAGSVASDLKKAGIAVVSMEKEEPKEDSLYVSKEYISLTENNENSIAVFTFNTSDEAEIFSEVSLTKCDELFKKWVIKEMRVTEDFYNHLDFKSPIKLNDNIHFFSKSNVLIVYNDTLVSEKDIKIIQSVISSIKDDNYEQKLSQEEYEEKELEWFKKYWGNLANEFMDEFATLDDAINANVPELMEGIQKLNLGMNDNNYGAIYVEAIRILNEINVYYETERYHQEYEPIYKELNQIKTLCQEKANEKEKEFTTELANNENLTNREKYNELKEKCNNYLNAELYGDLFTKNKSKWERSLSSIDKNVSIKEKDDNVNNINNKLNQLEKSLNGDLYDEIQSLVYEYSNNSFGLYEQYISEWSKRLQDVKEAVELEKKKKEIIDYKNQCITYAYNDFARNIESYKGNNVHFKGKVIQVVNQDSSGAELRVNVTKKYSVYTDTIYVHYINSNELDKVKFLEDDIIDLYGVAVGDYTYTAVLGQSITIPMVLAMFIDLN